MPPTEQELKDGIGHVSFEMNRYLYTANPKHQLPGRFAEIVMESCLLHLRNIGEFFFEGDKTEDDIRITHYFGKLISKNELENEIKKFESKWKGFKTRINKKVGHLTFSRLNTAPINMSEKNDIDFVNLINLFENNLPEEYKENWESGKSFSIDK